MKNNIQKTMAFLRNIKESKAFGKIIFVGLGISSIIWFLVRVIPKPSRAAYPCMKASYPFMSAFVIYILSFFGAIASWFRARIFIKNRKFAYATVFIAISIFSALVFTIRNSDSLYSQIIKRIDPAKMIVCKNQPVGVAKGIFPGRVVWVHNPGVSKWDGKTGMWFEEKWNSQEKANEMVHSALSQLSAEKNDKKAWNKLFISFNQTNRKGKLSYQNGQKVAIKINQNNTYSHDDSPEINASPQLIYALIKSLVNEGGVPQDKITVFDASRFITDFLFKKCHVDFPNVIFVDNEGGNGRTKATYKSEAISYSKDNGNLARGLANCVVEADYIINVALLKGHVGQGVTLCGKNWYGATNIDKDWRKNAHNNFGQNQDGSPKYMTFVDYMGHKDLGGKTFLYLIDGLYGARAVNGLPGPKWNMTPFNGSWPCSIFASQDPVAIDAVAIDFISSEWPTTVDINYADQYLLEAAKADNPPSGTHYSPSKDGIQLKSLGVLEHWNNETSKQYSRNINPAKGKGIELVYILNKN